MEEESAAISTTSWESDLVGAATVGNYLPIKRWVDNTLRIPCEEVKRCSPMNASLAGKMLRIAALNGKLAVVDLLRSYGESVRGCTICSLYHCIHIKWSQGGTIHL